MFYDFALPSFVAVFLHPHPAIDWFICKSRAQFLSRLISDACLSSWKCHKLQKALTNSPACVIRYAQEYRAWTKKLQTFSCSYKLKMDATGNESCRSEPLCSLFGVIRTPWIYRRSFSTVLYLLFCCLFNFFPSISKVWKKSCLIVSGFHFGGSSQLLIGPLFFWYMENKPGAMAKGWRAEPSQESNRLWTAKSPTFDWNLTIGCILSTVLSAMFLHDRLFFASERPSHHVSDGFLPFCFVSASN